MKKGLILLLLLLMTVSTTVLAEVYDTVHIVSVTSDRVHLREAPSTNAKSLGLYFTGTHATVLEEGTHWTYVMIGTEKGYVHNTLLTSGEVEHKARQATIIAKGTLNLRGWPSKKAELITRLPQGMELSVLGETHDKWSFVKAGDLYGYVMNEFIKTSGYVSTLPIAHTMPEELTGRWMYTSGAGGWRTVITIYPDGCFWGYYSDSDMGDTGLHYPYGTVYESHFTGHFAPPEKVNEHEYRLTMNYFQTFGLQNTKQIVNKIRYITDLPNGISAENQFTLYLPGTPQSQLSEDARFQFASYDLTENDPFLYNQTLQAGFAAD